MKNWAYVELFARNLSKETIGFMVQDTSGQLETSGPELPTKIGHGVMTSLVGDLWTRVTRHTQLYSNFKNKVLHLYQ